MTRLIMVSPDTNPQIALDAPQATVERLSADSATVRVPRMACPRCAAGHGCGAGIFAGRGGDVTLTVPIEPGTTVHVGERVSLSLTEGSLLRATVLAYGLPLGGLLLSAGAAVLGARSEAESIVWALAGTLAGFLLARRRLRQAHCLSSLQPRLGAALSPGAPR